MTYTGWGVDKARQATELRRLNKKTGLSEEERAKLKSFEHNERWWSEFEKNRPNHLMEIQNHIETLQLATKFLMMTDEEFIERWPGVSDNMCSRMHNLHETTMSRLRARFGYLLRKKNMDLEEIARLQKTQSESLRKWDEEKEAKKLAVALRKSNKAQKTKSQR